MTENAKVTVEGNELDDEELARRLARGDQRALEAVYLRYAGFVRGVIAGYDRGCAPSDIADLVHEVFLAAYDAAPRYRHEGKLKAWLCGIALHKVKHARRLRTRRLGLLLRFGRATPPSSTQAPDDLTRTRRDVGKALARLPDAQREVLVLHCVQQMEGEEIAVALGVSVNTVWTRLHRARSAMKRLFDTPGAEGEP